MAESVKLTGSNSVPRFRSMWQDPAPGCIVSSGDVTKDTFVVVAPYCPDPEGVVNEGPYPVRVVSGSVNLQEHIDSFREDTELKTILKHMAEAGQRIKTIGKDDVSDEIVADTTELSKEDVYALKQALNEYDTLKKQVNTALSNMPGSGADTSDSVSLSANEYAQFKNLIASQQKGDSTNAK